MFDFLHKSAPRYPTIREALTQSGLDSPRDPSGLTVLERTGSYSGRKVNFFRAYSQTDATEHALQVHGFDDLDGHPDLVLGSGHVEHDGQVVIARGTPHEGATPVRERADRTTHADDQRFVFWDDAKARTAEGALSAPAGVWLTAVSNKSTPAPATPTAPSVTP